MSNGSLETILSPDLLTEAERDFGDDESDDYTPIPAPAQITDLKRRNKGEPEQLINGMRPILNEAEVLRPVSLYNNIYEQNSMVRDINFAWLNNQTRYFCIYSTGPLGIGKTSFGVDSLRQLYGEYDYDGQLIKPCDDWGLIGSHIIFHPQSFKRAIRQLQKTRTRIKALVWDDSGIFLSAKDWQKAFAKEIVKYFQLARTYCASIILTTPSPSLILKDIRRLNMVTVKIMFKRAENSFSHTRVAKSYDHWYLPDLVKPRTKFRGKDEFDVMLPDSIYAPYQIMRAGYADYELERLWEIIGDDGNSMLGDTNFENLTKKRF